MIGLIMYAYVSGLFATFVNPKNRGKDFSWNWFVGYCERSAEGWLFTEGLDKKLEIEMGKQYAKEISTRLVNAMGDMEDFDG